MRHCNHKLVVMSANFSADMLAGHSPVAAVNRTFYQPHHLFYQQLLYSVVKSGRSCESTWVGSAGLACDWAACRAPGGSGSPQDSSSPALASSGGCSVRYIGKHQMSHVLTGVVGMYLQDLAMFVGVGLKRRHMRGPW